MEDRELTSEHVRAARALLRWEQRRLAEESGISLPTIGRLEMQPGVLSAYADTRSAIKAALERAGIVFLNDGSPGVQLKKKRIRIVADSGNPKGHITDPDEADRLD
jgi:DNA-binding XRE family transcriptional regulator